jgi:glycosyltransferase involved in cell wall biosynthesis
VGAELGLSDPGVIRTLTDRWTEIVGPSIAPNARLRSLPYWESMEPVPARGDGPGRDNLRQQVVQLGLEARVHMPGNQADVAPWLQALDVFALPSYANEGVPQALMQAMSCGLPCVTTNVGAIPELARDGLTARVVPAQDADAIRLAIVELLADQSLRSRLGMAAREHVVATHGRALMLDRMEALFHKAVEAS